MRKQRRDITAVTRGIIVHQVNNKGFMGRGVSREIKSLYPEHYNEYMDMCIKIQANKLLGRCVVTVVNEELYVVGVFTESISMSDRCYTDFHAMEVCLNEVKNLQSATNLPVYIPYLIGCTNVDNNWKVIQGIISRYLPKAILCYQ